jgi:PBP1b-binding outer membrane lipoprotein LpoB
MFKKAIPLVLMSGLVLTACANNGTNNGAVPKNNETPMENVDRTRDLTPNVNNGQTGPNMDGLDNNRDMNGNGVNDGIINNNGNRNGGNNEGNTTTPNEIIIDENTNTPNDVIIDENVNRNNGNNR